MPTLLLTFYILYCSTPAHVNSPPPSKYVVETLQVTNDNNNHDNAACNGGVAVFLADVTVILITAGVSKNTTDRKNSNS